MFAPFHYAFVQRGLVEALLLSVPAGILGTWIVLRGLAFFSHAVGTAAFPGLVLTTTLGRRWLATGFERQTARSLGVRAALLDTVLLATIAFAVVAALSAVGALLAAALYVLPAATARLWFRRLAAWQAASVALVAIESVVGLWLSVKLNAPPGPAIAVLAGAVFAAAAAARLARPRALLALLATLLLAGCGASAGAGGGLSVVATTTQ